MSVSGHRWSVSEWKNAREHITNCSFKEFSCSDFLCRLSYEVRREQVLGDFGGNCGNVNVKGTNKCCAASIEDTNHGSENLVAQFEELNGRSNPEVMGPFPAEANDFSNSQNCHQTRIRHIYSRAERVV